MNTTLPIEWLNADRPVPYEEAVAFMEARAAAIREGLEGECIWCLEHPALYTAGTSAKVADLFNPFGFPTYETGRGGEWTYHGPGQLVAYVMLDLKKHYAGTPDLRDFVKRLERWIIATLAEFGIEAFVREGRIGVWVSDGASESKIAALGIRVRQGVSYHGIAINIDPELSHFTGIVPCGIKEFGVTSLAKMGKHVTFGEVISALKKNSNKLVY